MAVVGLLLT